MPLLTEDIIVRLSISATIGFATFTFFFIHMIVELSGREPARLPIEAKRWAKRHKFLLGLYVLVTVFGVYLVWASASFAPEAASTSPVNGTTNSANELFFGLAKNDLMRMGEIIGISLVAATYIVLLLPIGKKGAQVFGVLLCRTKVSEDTTLPPLGMRKVSLIAAIVLLSSLSAPAVTVPMLTSNVREATEGVTQKPHHIESQAQRPKLPELFFGLNKNELLRVTEVFLLFLISLIVALGVVRPIIQSFVAEVSGVSFSKGQRITTTLLVIPATLAALLITLADRL